MTRPAKISPEQLVELRRDRALGIPVTVLADRYGVSTAAIYARLRTPRHRPAPTRVVPARATSRSTEDGVRYPVLGLGYYPPPLRQRPVRPTPPTRRSHPRARRLRRRPRRPRVLQLALPQPPRHPPRARRRRRRMTQGRYLVDRHWGRWAVYDQSHNPPRLLGRPYPSKTAAQEAADRLNTPPQRTQQASLFDQEAPA